MTSVTHDQASERYFRRRAGLPAPAHDQPRGWRGVFSPLNIVTLALTLVYAALLTWVFMGQLEVKRPDGLPDPNGHSIRALQKAFFSAVPTVLVLGAVFLLVDRWRPARWQMWWLALGWGGSVAVFVSMYLNTWVGSLMGADGGGARSAIYSAPFVEELAKASVLFVLAIAFRYRLVNTTNLVVLACLSAIGFAFVENIIYYVRSYSFAMNNISVGDPEEALSKMVRGRGYLTAWGHPSFTFYSGLGVAIALKARSKSVRICAPVVGFLLAAGGHMFFNFQASVGNLQDYVYLIIGWSLVFSFLVFVIMRWFGEALTVRMRLRDYVRTGWLPADDVRVYGTIRARIAGIIKATLRGPRCLWYTVKLMRRYTELAYLREGMVRGVIDLAGRAREKEIFDDIVALTPLALGDPRGKKFITWWRRRRPAPQFAPPSFPGPAGMGGNWPAPPPAPVPNQYASGDSSGGPPRF